MAFWSIIVVQYLCELALLLNIKSWKHWLLSLGQRTARITPLILITRKILHTSCLLRVNEPPWSFLFSPTQSSLNPGIQKGPRLMRYWLSPGNIIKEQQRPSRARTEDIVSDFTTCEKRRPREGQRRGLKLWGVNTEIIFGKYARVVIKGVRQRKSSSHA